jgi:hypothetical protein
MYYAKGYCARGEECNFAHGSGDVKTAPDFSYTQQCRSFMKTGRCRQGASCKFAHAVGQLRPWECSEEEYNEYDSQYDSQEGDIYTNIHQLKEGVHEYDPAPRAVQYEWQQQPQHQIPWALDGRSVAALPAPLLREIPAHRGQESTSPLSATVKRTFLHFFVAGEEDNFNYYRRCSSAPPRIRTH